ncbi:hypothetical protein [Kurthia huakuii]|uniref:hypothetical protein n=1 Tax=Kurthia huakuii TaxID=1421019 RepID=UPI0004973657|nr:hypothetical protein [Kurthia huakuii]MBM7698040.1 hypothetical protein [Kurthia huakuii]
MNMNKLACLFLPAFTMIAVSAIALTGGFGKTVEDNGQFIVFSLYMLYPAVFLFQGFVCALRGYTWIHPMIISVLAYAVMILMLQLQNYTYIISYIAAFAIGYVLTTIIRKARGKA